MKCKTCGESIVIFCCDDGKIWILDKAVRGFIGVHYCNSNGIYQNMLSKYMFKKLGLDEYDE
jgi:hypothetical protein